MKLKFYYLIFALLVGSKLLAIENKDSLFLNLLKPTNVSLYDNFTYETYIYEGFNLVMQDSIESGLSKLVKGLNLIQRNTNMDRVHDYQSQEFYQFLNLAVGNNSTPAQKKILINFFKQSKNRNINNFDSFLNKKWKKSDHPETSLRLLVFVYNLSNNSNKIVKYLNDLLLHFPNVFTGNLLKAEKLYSEDEWLKSKYYFSRSIKLNPTSSFAYLKRGICNKKLELFDEAKNDIKSAIKLTPKYTEAWNEIGRIYHDSGQYKKAISSYKKAIEINPLYVWGYSNIGLSYYNSRMKDSSLYFYNRAIEINPNNANYYNKKGDVYYKDKNFNEAIFNYSKAIELNPNKDYYWKDRGMANYKLKKWDLAIEDFTKAYELDREYEFALNKLGDCYLENQKWEKAIVYYDKAIEINPIYTNVLIDRAYCYLQLKKFETALLDYNMIIELDPLWEYSWLYRADCWIKMKNYESAKNDLLKAIEVNPENSSGYGNLGWVYYCLGDFEKCIAFSKKAIELEENPFYAKFNYALATLRKGDFDRAKRLYQKYYKEAQIKNENIVGSIGDLENLLEKKIHVSEVNYILTEIFHYHKLK